MTRTRRLLPVCIGIAALVAIALLPAALPTEEPTSTLAIARGDGAYATVAPGAVAAPPRPIGAIFGGGTVAQEFPAAGTEITEAALVLATYQRDNSGTIQVMVQAQANGQWQTLGSRTVRKASLRDNVLNAVTFDPPLAVKRGQSLRIVLQADGSEQNAITWWINPSYQRPGFALSRDGESVPGAAQFQISYGRRTGRLAGMIGPLWTRATLFLDTLWRVVLAAGLLMLAGGFLVLGRFLPDRVHASARRSRRPSPLPGVDGGVFPPEGAGETSGEAAPERRDAAYVAPAVPDRAVDR